MVYSQALDVAPVAFYDIDEVIHVAVLPEEYLCIVDLVLLHTVFSLRYLQYAPGPRST